MGPKPNNWCPFKRKEKEIWGTDTQRGGSCKNGGRDWSHLWTSQGSTKNCQQLPEAKREEWNGFSEPPEGTSLASNLILDFRPPELWGNTFLFEVSQFLVLCYGSPRKPILDMAVTLHSGKPKAWHFLQVFVDFSLFFSVQTQFTNQGSILLWAVLPNNTREKPLCLWAQLTKVQMLGHRV